MDRRNFINFRAPDDLVEQLDEFVELQRRHGVRLSRAQAARLLIETALRDDTKASVLAGTLSVVNGALKKVTTQIGEEMGARVSALLEAELMNQP